MKNLRHLLSATAYSIIIVSTLLLVLGSFYYVNEGPTPRDADYIRTMTVSVEGGPSREIQLPYSFEGLGHRTRVTLTATVHPAQGDMIYIRSLYAPAEIYLDGEPAFTFGDPANYPDFMKDPANEVHLIDTRGDGSPQLLTMDFYTPITRDNMLIYPPILGSSKEIILAQFHAYAMPFVLSLAQIIYGISLIIICICTLFIDRSGISFLWLGLLSLSTGLWALGESYFSAVISKNAALLYILSFTGFYTFIFPLLRFVRSIVNFENPRLLKWLELFLAACSAIALTLQLTGVLAFSRSMYFFYFALPLSLVIVTAVTIREFLLYKKVSARRMIIPCFVLAASALLGLTNFLLLPTYTVSSRTQMGVLFFLLTVGVAAGLSVKDSIKLQDKEKELTFEKGLMAIRIKEQKSHGLLLAQHEQLLSQQRHDLRHHLEVIRGLTSDSNVELKAYLDQLLDNIPKSQKSFCENQAVNAIVRHYDSICHQKGIELILHLAVPESNPNLSDTMLCVIFGNLLENAVEACDRMAQGHKFIKLSTRIQYGMLTITMDNSFNGQVRTENGRFRSSKRDDFGIGLTSVQSVAQKSGGNAEFQGKGQVFLSSVYVKL